MSSNTSGLGAMAVLPAEVRTYIWQYLFTPSPSHPDTSPEQPPFNPGKLAILRTSQQVYREVSHELYRNIAVEFDVSGHSGIVFSITVPGLCKTEHITNGKSLQRSVWRHFPYHRADTKANLYAPEPQDPGQLIILWRGINKLVDCLGWATRLKTLDIGFCVEDAAWHAGHGQGNTTVRLPSMGQPAEGELSDHQVALLPFSRLSNVGKVSFHCEQTGAQHLDWEIFEYLSRQMEGRGRSPRFQFNQLRAAAESRFRAALAANLPGNSAAYLRKVERAMSNQRKVRR